MKMTPDELADYIDKLSKDFEGDFSDLYRAVGVLSVGDAFGWRVLRITLGSATYTKYQRILGVEFKEIFPERGRYAHKSIGLDIVDGMGNFWKVVRGAEKIDPIKKKSISYS